MSFTNTISLASESKIAPLTDVLETLPVAVGEELERARGASGRLRETLPLRILADRFEQVAEDERSSSCASLADAAA